MPTDFRIEVGFIDHPKTVKLERRLGFDAVKCLIRLWGWTAENRPKGILYGMTDEDIEIACRWNGTPGTFINLITSEDCRWIDKTPEGYELHDWKKHQGYIYHSPERSERARHAISKRWEKDRNTDSIPLVYGENTKSNTPSPVPSPVPLPVPVPSPAPLAERLEHFKDSILSTGNKYPKSMLFTGSDPNGEQDNRSFFGYWSEVSEKGRKMRWEKQPTFDITKRLATWASRNNGGSHGHTIAKSPKPGARGYVYHDPDTGEPVKTC